MSIFPTLAKITLTTAALGEDLDRLTVRETCGALMYEFSSRLDRQNTRIMIEVAGVALPVHLERGDGRDTLTISMQADTHGILCAANDSKWTAVLWCDLFIQLNEMVDAIQLQNSICYLSPIDEISFKATDGVFNSDAEESVKMA